MVYIPPTYTLPDLPDASDNGVILCIIILPAVIILCCMAGICSCLDESGSQLSSYTNRTAQGFLFYCGSIFFMLSIGFANVHTEREAMADFWNLVVDDWLNAGGQEVFQNLSTFTLTPSSSSSYTMNKSFALQPRVLYINPTGHTEGLPKNVPSVYQEVNVSHSDFERYAGYGNIKSLVQGGLVQTNSMTLSTYTYYSSSTTRYWNTTYYDTVYCSYSYCTDGCSSKTKTRGYCSIEEGSPLRDYCEIKLGGIFIPRSVNATSCVNGGVCGTCKYSTFLDSVCMCMQRTTTRAWDTPTTRYSPCSSNTPVCNGQRWVRANQWSGNPYVSVRLMSTHDPGLRLQQVTSGTLNFPISSREKYHHVAPIFGGVCAFCFLAFFMLYAAGEEWWCFDPASRASGQYSPIAGGVGGGLFGGSNSSSDAANLIGGNNNNARAAYGTGRGNDDDDDSLNNDSSDDSFDDKVLCQICYAAPRDARLLPCQHHVCCKTCANRMMGQSGGLGGCPICREKITGIQDCDPKMPTFGVFSRTSSDGSSGVNSEASLTNRQCTICWAAPRNARFRPCGHLSCCRECANLITSSTRKCVLCRERVDSVEPCQPGEPTFRAFGVRGGGRR